MALITKQEKVNLVRIIASIIIALGVENLISQWFGNQSPLILVIVGVIVLVLADNIIKGG